METNFIDIVFTLSDGTMRELNVQAGEHRIARPEYEYNTDDFELFISYLRNSMIGNISAMDLTDVGICVIADMLPAYLIGQWLQHPLPNGFLDRNIGEDVYITDIWSITTPNVCEVNENPDWLWLTNQVLRP